MKAHFTEEEIISYLEEGEKDREIADHLISCMLCQKMAAELKEIMQIVDQSESVDPPLSIRRGFESALEEEKVRIGQASKGPVLQAKSRPVWPVAATVALLVGFLIGKMSAPDQSDKIIALRSQVELLKELSTVNTLQTHTASERIQAVNIIEEEKPSASDNLIKTLVNTLNTDESPNVRYAAAQALNRYIDQENVRLALSGSLEHQEDPLIQLSLISMLVEMQEKTAIKPIKKIMRRDSITPEVKKQAEVALQILS